MFFVAPLALIAVYSFGSVDPVSLDVFFGWTTANYRAFASTLYLHSLLRSVLLSLGATAACAVLGFSLAYFISRQPPRAQRLLLVAVIVPFWTSFIVRTYSWVDLLQNLGPDRPAGRHRSGLTSGTSRRPVHADRDRDRHRLLVPAADGAADLRLARADRPGDLQRGGRPRRDALAPVPQGRAAARACRAWSPGSIIVGIPALGEYVIPEILGGGKTLMLGNILADQFQNTGDYPFGSALAVTLMGILLILLFILRTARSRCDETAA